jgi:hypothetical protein
VKLCFAIFVHNLQLRGNAGRELTRSATIRLLTKEGIDTKHFHLLFGIRRRPTQRLSLKKLPVLKTKKVAVLYNDRHVAVCSEGYFDDFGTARKIENELPLLMGKKATGWFEIK